MQALVQVQVESLVELRMLGGTVAAMASKSFDDDGALRELQKYGPAWDSMASALLPRQQVPAAAAAAAEPADDGAAAEAVGEPDGEAA